MPYSMVQYIGVSFDTSLLRKEKIDIKKRGAKIETSSKYKGAMDTNADISIRIDFIEQVLAQIKSRSDTRDSVLKIFMLPNFIGKE